MANWMVCVSCASPSIFELTSDQRASFACTGVTIRGAAAETATAVLRTKRRAVPRRRGFRRRPVVLKDRLCMAAPV
jgi:hypothetical protein